MFDRVKHIVNTHFNQEHVIEIANTMPLLSNGCIGF